MNDPLSHCIWEVACNFSFPFDFLISPWPDPFSACNSWEESDDINSYFCHQLSTLSIPCEFKTPLTTKPYVRWFRYWMLKIKASGNFLVSPTFIPFKARGGGVKIVFPVFTYLIRAARDEQVEKNCIKTWPCVAEILCAHPTQDLKLGTGPGVP